MKYYSICVTCVTNIKIQPIKHIHTEKKRLRGRKLPTMCFSVCIDHVLKFNQSNTFTEEERLYIGKHPTI